MSPNPKTTPTWARQTAFKILQRAEQNDAFVRPLIESALRPSTDPSTQSTAQRPARPSADPSAQSATQRPARPAATPAATPAAASAAPAAGPASPSAAERDFASLLAIGATSAQGELDALIQSTLPGKKISPEAHIILRLMLYELLYLQKKPYVALDQGIALCRQVAPHAAKFVTWAAHRLLQAAQGFPWGDPASDLAALAHAQAFPLWLAERLTQELGCEQAATFMAASNLAPPTFAADLQNNDCLRLSNSQLASLKERLKRGEVIIADATTQLVARLVAEQAAQQAAQQPFGQLFRLLELGAGRGTKTVLLNRALQQNGLARFEHWAVDLYGYKVSQIQARIQQYGLKGVKTLVADINDLPRLAAATTAAAAAAPTPAAFAPASATAAPAPASSVPTTAAPTPAATPAAPEPATASAPAAASALAALAPASFQAVFIDAPCSGSGTLRRHPEARWRLQPSEITRLAAQAQGFLQAAAPLVAPGGSLFFSTCSVFAEENAAQIQRFLQSPAGLGFKPAALPQNSSASSRYPTGDPTVGQTGGPADNPTVGPADNPTGSPAGGPAGYLTALQAKDGDIHFLAVLTREN